MNQLSYISNAEPAVIDHYYQLYKTNPQELDPSWQRFFEGFDLAQQFGNQQPDANISNTPTDNSQLEKELHVVHLIHSYRSRGHLLAKTNPLKPRLQREAGVGLNFHDLKESDLEQRFFAGTLIGLPNAQLKDIVAKLEAIYCRGIGFECMHIRNTEIREWCKQKFEQEAHNYNFSIDKKRRIFNKLNEAVVFESFLHKRYVGQKRFSLEGGENTIPALDAIINKAAELGVRRFAIGMAHRGRLNVLANTLHKTYEYIFDEFEGHYHNDFQFGDGDVKYHLGFSSKTKAVGGQDVYVSLLPNPSHLEAVNPVLQGYVKGKGDLIYGGDFKQIMPITIHGDAALAGQGVVYELAQMANIPAYQTGGTLHFVINNQIGFTTNFWDARSSDYSTAVGKVIDCPILHVNGDDAEAVIFAVEFATEFRQKFGKDVFVDMVCYRKYGHNESDEPRFTNPKMYDLIAQHANARDIYRDELIKNGSMEANLAKEMEKSFIKLLDDRQNMVKQQELKPIVGEKSPQWQNRTHGSAKDFEQSPKTAVEKSVLDKVIKALTSFPDTVKPFDKVVKLLQDRKDKYNKNSLDWSLGELLAYGTLLAEGKNVRMSGQDVIRGTFTHRHAMLIDKENEQWYSPLNHIESQQGKFEIYNSLLSEYAVLGFEYGYATASPDVLTLWEAQFGDFSNGAQIIIDQFISSGESKWNRMSGLVMLLPHGYEGQGPEHSNARPERFLQLAAEYNMIVANCTTPANFFHLLRRQLAWDFRKPLVVMSPKSLLRHPLCVSPIEDLTDKNFQEVIDDAVVASKKVKRVLFCSGKIYYDLLKYQTENSRKDVAIVRIEQLHPMPEQQIEAIYSKYAKATYFWVQEEPKNMGCWTYMLRFEANIQKMKLISRKASASPATGFSKVHEKEQQHIINQAFGVVETSVSKKV